MAGRKKGRKEGCPGVRRKEGDWTLQAPTFGGWMDTEDSFCNFLGGAGGDGGMGRQARTRLQRKEEDG